MKDKEVIDILDRFKDVLSVSDMWESSGRFLMWMIVKLFVAMTDALDGSFETIISMGGFFDSDQVVAFYEKYQPVFLTLCALSLLVIGYFIMTNKLQNKGTVATNILIAVCFILILPNFMLQLQSLSSAGVESVGEHDVNLGTEVVKENLTDVKYYAGENFEGVKPDDYENFVPGKYVMDIEINETLDRDEPLDQRLVLNTEGEQDLADLSSGSFVASIGEQNYYRWQPKFLYIMFTLGISCFVLLVSLFKTARIIFELAFYQLYGSVVAVTDLATGQRTKQVISSIMSMFLVLIVIAVNLKLFTLFTSWLSTIDSINGFLKIILMLGAAFAVVDGPKIVERTLGIDAGVKDGYKDLAALYMGGKAISSMGRTVSQLTNKASNKGANSGKGSESMNMSKNGGKLNNQEEADSSSSAKQTDNSNTKEQTGENGASEEKNNQILNRTNGGEDKKDGNNKENEGKGQYVDTKVDGKDDADSLKKGQQVDASISENEDKEQQTQDDSEDAKDDNTLANNNGEGLHDKESKDFKKKEDLSKQDKDKATLNQGKADLLHDTPANEDKKFKVIDGNKQTEGKGSGKENTDKNSEQAASGKNQSGQQEQGMENKAKALHENQKGEAKEGTEKGTKLNETGSASNAEKNEQAEGHLENKATALHEDKQNEDKEGAEKGSMLNETGSVSNAEKIEQAEGRLENKATALHEEKQGEGKEGAEKGSKLNETGSASTAEKAAQSATALENKATALHGGKQESKKDSTTKANDLQTTGSASNAEKGTGHSQSIDNQATGIQSNSNLSDQQASSHAKESGSNNEGTRVDADSSSINNEGHSLHEGQTERSNDNFSASESNPTAMNENNEASNYTDTISNTASGINEVAANTSAAIPNNASVQGEASGKNENRPTDYASNVQQAMNNGSTPSMHRPIEQGANQATSNLSNDYQSNVGGSSSDSQRPEIITNPNHYQPEVSDHTGSSPISGPGASFTEPATPFAQPPVQPVTDYTPVSNDNDRASSFVETNGPDIPASSYQEPIYQPPTSGTSSYQPSEQPSVKQDHVRPMNNPVQQDTHTAPRFINQSKPTPPVGQTHQFVTSKATRGNAPKEMTLHSKTAKQMKGNGPSTKRVHRKSNQFINKNKASVKIRNKHGE